MEADVLGVIEIASFNHFEKYELEFIEKLAESIASTLATAKINEQTQILLEQSRKQAAEMAEQEEIMRQNMEELQATQEESARRENEMFGILQAINRSSYYFETDLNGIIHEINTPLLTILEMRKEEVIGKHHDTIIPIDTGNADHTGFWEVLRRGESFDRKQKFISASNREIWLKQVFTPIIDKDKNPLKVICISTDITDGVMLENEYKVIRQHYNENQQTIKMMNDLVDEDYVRCDLTEKGFILNANSSWQGITGYNQKILQKTRLADLIPESSRKEFINTWDKILHGYIFKNQMEIKINNGTIITIFLVIKPFFEGSVLKQIGCIGNQCINK
jgi:PAS domain S-box-containing protein